MAKEKLKKDLKKLQSDVCALTGKPLSEVSAFFDTDRVLPKASGGTYKISNTRAVDPVAHMKRHGIYRERDVQLERLKALVDDREQVLGLSMKVLNQLRAYERGVDHLNEMTKAWLQAEVVKYKSEASVRTRLLGKLIKEMAKTDPLVKAALGVRGVGEITIAYCLVYIDLTKARHASSVWKYVGLHVASHERYTRGVSGGGNKRLRSILYTMADAQVKIKDSAYRYIYDRKKTRLADSDRIVKSRNTEGILIECAWKDTKPSHRDGAAKRDVMKHFLADWWYVGRDLLGLPTAPGYAEAKLEGDHRTIMPSERGWVW